MKKAKTYTTYDLPVMTYDLCESLLEEHEKIPLTNETILERHTGFFTITLFGNEILAIYPTHQIVSFCGHPTYATKQRLNKFTKHVFFTEKGVLYVTKYAYNHFRFDFDNAVQINSSSRYIIINGRIIREYKVDKQI